MGLSGGVSRGEVKCPARGSWVSNGWWARCSGSTRQRAARSPPPPAAAAAAAAAAAVPPRAARACMRGPMAMAPVDCCTALYVLLPVLRSGKMHTLALPATWGEAGRGSRGQGGAARRARQASGVEGACKARPGCWHAPLACRAGLARCRRVRGPKGAARASHSCSPPTSLPPLIFWAAITGSTAASYWMGPAGAAFASSQRCFAQPVVAFAQQPVLLHVFSAAGGWGWCAWGGASRRSRHSSLRMQAGAS